MEIKTPIEWNDFAEDFLDADGNIFRADQIATALNLATDREERLVEALGVAANRLKGVAIAIQAHGTNIDPQWWIEQHSKWANEARAVAEHKGENGTSTN